MLEKGVNRLEDLVEFNVVHVNIIAETLRKPEGLVPESEGNRVEPALMLDPIVRIGVKALERLEALMHIMKYYEMVNPNLLASILRHIILSRTLSLNLILLNNPRRRNSRYHN